MVKLWSLERFWYDARLEERCWNDGRNMLMLELCNYALCWLVLAQWFCCWVLLGLACFAAGLLWPRWLCRWIALAAVMLERCWSDAGAMLERCWNDAGKMLERC